MADAEFLYINKVKVTSFGRATNSYSAVQPLFVIKLPLSLGYTRKLAFASPWGKYFTPGLCAVNMRRPGISNLKKHSPFRVPIHILGELGGLGDTFLMPREIHVRPVQDSNHGPFELQQNVLPLYQPNLLFYIYDYTTYSNAQFHYYSTSLNTLNIQQSAS